MRLITVNLILVQVVKNIHQNLHVMGEKFIDLLTVESISKVHSK